ncbi:GtrA family protein [Aquipuribacter sp. SD81]|uniref:GtrA family protein n=1 Tax=Aquipuribacter sp. SD81 TaxID=3127703 RepID=UPI0030199CBD
MSTADRVDDGLGEGPVEARSAGPRARLLALYRHSLTRFLAFSAVGLSFDLAVLALLDATTPLPAQASVTVAFALTYALNFALNRWFAFDAAHGHVRGQLRRFLPQVGADYLLVVFGVTVLTALGLPLLLARLLSAFTNAVLNYTAYRWWTFRDALPGRGRR